MPGILLSTFVDLVYLNLQPLPGRGFSLTASPHSVEEEMEARKLKEVPEACVAAGTVRPDSPSQPSL